MAVKLPSCFFPPQWFSVLFCGLSVVYSLCLPHLEERRKIPLVVKLLNECLVMPDADDPDGRGLGYLG